MGGRSSINDTIKINKRFDKKHDKETDYHNKADNNTVISRDNDAINGINIPLTGYTVGQTGLLIEAS
jgi:hypothetical protein